MNDPEIKQFIRKHNDLFWYIPEDKKEEIGHELLIETILNDGNLDDARHLVRLMGINHIASIFFGLEGRKKLNYYPEVYHFFSLLFKKYASGNS